MKKIIVISLLLISIASLIGCGSNENAKQWGGTTNLELPKGKKLINITWKDNDLWYLTKDMKDNDVAETYEFSEKSNYGISEGKVVIKESK